MTSGQVVETRLRGTPGQFWLKLQQAYERAVAEDDGNYSVIERYDAA